MYSQIRQGIANTSKGTAFVVYEDVHDAKQACDKLNGFNFQNRYLVGTYCIWIQWAPRIIWRWLTLGGIYSLVSSAREDGPYERGHYGKAGEFRTAQTATRDRMMWRILFLFPLLAFSCAWYCNGFTIQPRLGWGVTGVFIPWGFFFLISEGLMVGEAGSGRHILTQKWSCEQHAGEIWFLLMFILFNHYYYYSLRQFDPPLCSNILCAIARC